MTPKYLRFYDIAITVAESNEDDRLDKGLSGSFARTCEMMAKPKTSCCFIVESISLFRRYEISSLDVMEKIMLNASWSTV